MARLVLLSRTTTQPCTCSLRYLATGATPSTDHYAILGVQPGADAKEIKAAYYKLSKQFHPDRNTDDKKDEAAQKFHQVAQAYEVLGTEENRRIYDLTRIRTAPDLGYGSARSAYNKPTKQYTDLDIDYKNFEQFQRNTRRRRQFHSHFDMPDEFYAEFGGKKRVYKSEYEETVEMSHSNHKDSRTLQREQEELLRDIERQKAEQQAKHPIPTFEQMLRDKRKKEADEQKKYLTGLFGVCSIGMLLLLAVRN